MFLKINQLCPEKNRKCFFLLSLVVLDIAVLYSRSDNGIDLPFAFNVCVLILLLIIIVFQIHKKSNLKKSLLQSSKLASIGEVASGIAHEINNPLTIISGHVNKLELKNKENSEIQSSSAKIKKQIQRITKIINGLRSFSRDTSNESVHLVDIVRVINNSVEFCSDKLKELDIVLKFEFVGDVYVECNEIQIEQVLVNLINNSCDAIFHLEKKWIEIKLEQQNDEVEIRVIDSGAGIPSKIVDKIMEPFFSTKETGKGTGLGLSISRAIIEGHHGKLEIDSLSKNTAFLIKLKHSIRFDVAIQDHISWVNKFERYSLNPNGSIKDEDVCRDDQCNLGRWIYKVENDFSTNLQFQKLKVRHKTFHELASELVKDINGKKSTKEISDKQLKFTSNSEQVILAIDELKKSFESN